MPTLLGHRSLVLEKLLAVDRLRALCAALPSEPGPSAFAEMIRLLQVSYSVEPAELLRIPRTGPALVVANHPFGILEGLLLGAILSSVRTDVRIMANHLLHEAPVFQDYLIPINPFEGSQDRVETNARGIRRAIEWLKRGGLVVVFPAGEVSHWKLRQRSLQDPPWSPAMARLARIAAAPVLPVYFAGSNSVPFYMLGMVHPMLRTARLPQELLNKRGKQFAVRIGSLIPASQIEAASDADAVSYFRERTYLLGSRHRCVPPRASAPDGQPCASRQAAIQREIRNLPPSHTLVETAAYSVHISGSEETPNTLDEIGRLREATFRTVGEGTGKARDLDVFDSYYQHLFLWSKTNHELVGAYRVGNTSRILPEKGVGGLYTSTLFHYERPFFERLGPALELGRSFIRVEYQKQPQPLLLLWKGLYHWMGRNPGVNALFGAVSISADYSLVSRRLLAAFCARHRGEGWNTLVSPRRPFAPGPSHNSILSVCRDIDAISSVICDIEPDGKGVPVLLKHYWKLGGRIIDFSLDPAFGGCLDGLLVLDLRQSDGRMLQRLASGPRATTAAMAR